MNKKIITLIALIIPIVVVIYLSFKLKDDEIDSINQNHINAIGIITNVGWKTVDISYSIDNILYTYTEGIPYKDIAVGEEFHILVNKDNLNKVLVCYSEPNIDTTKHLFKLTYPFNIEKVIIDASELSFHYKVGDVMYDRIQKVGTDLQKIDLNNLRIKYRVDHPEIGYLVRGNF